MAFLTTSFPPPLWRQRFSRRRRRLQRRWIHAPANLRGSAFMAGGLVTFAVMIAVIKALGPNVPLPQLLVIRQIITMTLLAPLFLRDPCAALRTAHPVLQVLRGLSSLGAMYFSFLALRNIPLADSTALGFAQVLFVTVLAVLVLKEKVSARRWLATGAGFVGVLIMLRPGAGSFDVFALAALPGALCNSAVSISVRLLSDGERTSTILLWQGMVLLAVLAIPAALTWVPLSPIEWAAMGLIGLSGTLGQWFMTRAYQTGEAASLAPLDFSKLLLHTLTGWLIFSEVPHSATIAGAALVIGATLVVLRGNATPALSSSLPNRDTPEPPAPTGARPPRSGTPAPGA